jgi:hypothetical protein
LYLVKKEYKTFKIKHLYLLDFAPFKPYRFEKPIRFEWDFAPFKPYRFFKPIRFEWDFASFKPYRFGKQIVKSALEAFI